MKLKEFIEQLQKLVEENPECLEYPVCAGDWQENYSCPSE
jgi:hypothetical protein